MDLIPLTPAAYQLRGGANAGLIVHAGRAVLVDTGLDQDTAKKILRHVESLHVTLAAVVITHAHADHFGGAALIRSRTAAPVFAPPLEAAIIANPILEPLYLFSGAAPRPTCATSSPWPRRVRWMACWWPASRSWRACRSPSSPRAAMRPSR